MLKKLVHSMTQINLEKIKEQQPKSKGYFITQNVLIITLLSIFLFITAFFSAVLYRVIADGVFFPRLIGVSFWLSSILGLALLLTLLFFAVKIYRFKDWKLGQNWLLVFLSGVLLVGVLTTLWVTTENQLKNEDDFVPSNRAQNVFRKLKPFSTNPEDVRVFRGKITNIDTNNHTITVTNPEESVIFGTSKDALEKFELETGQRVAVLYSEEGNQKILVQVEPPQPMGPRMMMPRN